jgi:NTP pyrophosphatase (non-canonical NTP hydrolase)
MKLQRHIDLDGTMSDMAKDEVRVGIRTLATAVSNTAHAHGWWSDDDGNTVQRNMGEMIALMHSELSEALEAYRNNEPTLWYEHALPTVGLAMDQREYNGVLGKPQGVASEFADVIIRILDTCATLGIPIATALLDKHEYNLSRPYRHGGKAC